MSTTISYEGKTRASERPSERPGGRGKKERKGGQQRDSLIGMLRGEEKRGGRDDRERRRTLPANSSETISIAKSVIIRIDIEKWS